MKVTLQVARKLNEGEKLTPQARQMVDLIVGAGEGGIEKGELVKQLTPIVKTRQPVERIVAFYQQTLGEKGTGLLKVVKESTAAPKKEEAPAAVAA